MFQGVQVRGVRGFVKKIHTQMCLSSLFDQRCRVDNEWKKVENKWEDDEDEQKRAFHEEEKRCVHQEKVQQLKCEITATSKRSGSTDCQCKGMCMARISETHLIHYEGGVGIIPKK
jgi:uncharacterized protein YlxW (UPF0749 family)